MNSTRLLKRIVLLFLFLLLNVAAGYFYTTHVLALVALFYLLSSLVVATFVEDVLIGKSAMQFKFVYNWKKLLSFVACILSAHLLLIVMKALTIKEPLLEILLITYSLMMGWAMVFINRRIAN